MAAWQPPVRAQSSIVSISVPVALQLEGTTVQTVTAGSPVFSRLTVKSNVPWLLLADVDGGSPALVVWSDDAAWQPLPPHGIVLRGPKGVHHLTFRLRAGAANFPAVVRFSLARAP